MLDPTLASQLKAYLGNITTPIELIAAVDEGPKSAELVELLTEIAGMSEQITLNLEGIRQRPAAAARRS